MRSLLLVALLLPTLLAAEGDLLTIRENGLITSVSLPSVGRVTYAYDKSGAIITVAIEDLRTKKTEAWGIAYAGGSLSHVRKPDGTNLDAGGRKLAWQGQALVMIGKDGEKPVTVIAEPEQILAAMRPVG